jgi:hypothetical protein
MELHSSPFGTQPAQIAAPVAPSPLQHSTHRNAPPDSGMHSTATSHGLAEIVQALATTSDTSERPGNHSGSVQHYLESLMDDSSHIDPMHTAHRTTQQSERADTRHDPSRARGSSSDSSSPTSGGAGSLSHVDAGGRASMVDVGEVRSTGGGRQWHVVQTADVGCMCCNQLHCITSTSTVQSSSSSSSSSSSGNRRQGCLLSDRHLTRVPQRAG